MKNPFKPDRSDQDRDNPIVPNAIERPVERAAGRDRDDVVHGHEIVDRPGINDGPGDRPGIKDSPTEIARGRAAGAPVVDRPFVNDGAGDRPGALDHGSETARAERTHDDTRHTDLFPDEELAGYRTQWEAIQTGFVDQPREAVAQADALVSQLVTRLTDVFTRERSTLEGQWAKGDNVSTEDLRVALTRYRSFFHRLLSM